MKNENNLARKIFISTLVLTLFFICLSSANAADVHMNSTNNTISNVVANETTNGDTIYLDEGNYNHTHLNGTNGTRINKNITIIGKGADKTIIDAEKQGRMFNIVANGTLTLINLTLTNGNHSGSGGAINNNGGKLTMINCILNNNLAESNGGVINSVNGENITIINSSFFKNTAGYGGGAINVQNRNNNYIIVINSNFTNNTVEEEGGAIRTYWDTNIYVNNCNFINNIATANNSGGGAIGMPQGTGNRIINNSTFINNTIYGTLQNYGGGAIYNSNGNLNITNSIFINNTALYGGIIYNGGIVFIEGCNIINNHNVIYSTNHTTIKFSRIFNNTGYDIYIIKYPYPGYLSSVNASFNWWGINNPDLEIKAGGRIRGNGDLTIDNFFVMNVINLTALDSNKDLIFKYTFGLNNTDYFDPSLLPFFETIFYNNLVGFLESFDARYNKTLVDSISVRNKTIEYIFTTDNETQSFIAHISPGNTNITVNSPNGKNGEIVDLVAKLTDDEGEPLVNREVIFNIDGKQFTATTNSEGIAIINYTIDKNDFINRKLNITVGFYGDDGYFASNGTGTITLDKTKTNLVVNNSNGKIGNLITLIAKLTDENGNLLSNKIIKFYIDGVYVGVAITDINGVAIFSYKPTKEGNFTITTIFEGDDTYLDSTSKNLLIVTGELEPTPTPTPEPTNKTKPNQTKPTNQTKPNQKSTNQTDNNLINTNKTTANMKQTGIPIITILIVLLSSLGLVYRKK